ncbi:permease-like cell division protein FtsX [Iodobacter fluviatilis]|jgi:cell division transport system permease protein|uniref:Cell division protein FtsX n=1 Tax=Iodobacter fluviatilis TaxID=537 RepID=A0A7G3G884_9NEIS|nr:permease-like cell division protein FtsX [Iodobacter fluviatilis]QBC43374.1 ABC transporter permease [Iodobacter fluviatilis]
MKHWLRLHGQSLARTLGALVRHPFSSALNLLVIGITAALPLALWLVISSVSSVASQIHIEPQISIFMRDSATKEDLSMLAEQLKKDPRIASSRFIAKDEALKEMQASSGAANLLAGLSENPLPDAFILSSKDGQATKLEALQKDLLTRPGVDEIQLDSAWAHRLERLLALGQTLFEVIVVLLATALALITGNAIRMQILTRKEEIEVARLIGATDAFIRRPFIYFAMVQGLLGGLFACAIVAGILSHLNPAVFELANAYGQKFSLLSPDFSTVVIVCGLCTLLTFIGAWLAVWRHLRQFT